MALGVMVIALSPVTGPANDLPSQGLYISSVEDYSDLNNHDITVGDVILTADGVTLETTSDLLDVLERTSPAKPCGWRSKSAAAAMSSPWTRCWPRAAATEASKQKAPPRIYPAAAPCFSPQVKNLSLIAHQKMNSTMSGRM